MNCEAVEKLNLTPELLPTEPVLITGATGLVGGHLAKRLHACGVPIKAMVRRRSQVDPFAAKGIPAAVADLMDADSLEPACTGSATVIHCAAMTNRSRGAARDAWRVNGLGPAHLWEAAARAGVRRLVYCSTAGVHGPMRRWPIDEDGPLRPDSLYRRSKLAGERLLMKRAGASPDVSMETVVARLTSVAGPHTGRTWSSLIDSIRQQRVVLVGDGTNPVHITDVDDICQGIMRCATHPSAAGRTYIIGAVQWTTLIKFLTLFSQVLGLGNLVPARRLPAWPARPLGDWAMRCWSRLGWEPNALHKLSFLVGARAFCVDRARQELGFMPRFNTQSTVRRTLAGMR